ncbi:hypothetical protein [Bizionia paragorgiae]|mgnify:CR=1 FL=1
MKSLTSETILSLLEFEGIEPVQPEQQKARTNTNISTKIKEYQ